MLARCTRGIVALEYGLIVALIVIALLGAMSFVGSATRRMWTDVGNSMPVT
jgi:pilus assembly protein Flp/PilA